MDSASYGKPKLYIKKLYILAALDFLLEGAKKLRERNVVTHKILENDITYYLSKEMDKIQLTRRSDIIWWEPRANTQNDPDDPLSRCEIDIKFRWAQYNRDLYLVVEAKRLFGQGSSKADDYVEKGVMDFVTGKYSRGHNYGIMLGYIQKGPIAKVISSVNDAMVTRKAQTLENSSFALNNSLCIHPYTHHSVHLQQGTAVLITLIHIFLDFSTETAL